MLHLCHWLCVPIGTVDEGCLMPLGICIQVIICIQRGCFQPWGSSVVQPLPHRALSETKHESDLHIQSRRYIAWDERDDLQE